MKIKVFGGSPKGDVSVTMQAVYWLREQFPEHQFEICYAAKEIKRLERDEAMFWKAVEEAAEADGILFAYPLYYGLVHSGLKRFLELLKERKRDSKPAASLLEGKHAALYSTSIHFYDHTALDYMQGVLEDMGMQVDDGFSAGMRDLLHKTGQDQLRLFFEKWMQTIAHNIKKNRQSAPLHWNSRDCAASLKDAAPPLVYNMKVGIVMESGRSANLDAMVKTVSSCFEETEIFDLSQIKMAGPCLGCLKCGYDNQCVYEGKDEVIETHRKLRECDGLIFAGAITDRYLSAVWTSFINRLFFSTHIPFYTGKPVGYLFSGPYQQLSAMKGIFTGLFACFEMRVSGVVTDEETDVADRLAGLAESLFFHYEKGYCQPETFQAVGGKHIFRDEIFANLRGVFCADHKYYRSHGLYDFPQKKLGDRLAGMFMYLSMKIAPVRRQIQSDMPKYMVLSYKKLYARPGSQ